MTSQDALDINYLKANAKKIHFFGLGFIQIKISDTHRVHVYTDKFQTTAMEEEIHNHRYQFNSAILKGALTQKVYDVHNDKEGEYLLTQESCNPEVVVQDRRAVFCDIKLTQIHHFTAGAAYWTAANTFHKVESKNAVTFITRGGYEKTEADVIYHHTKLTTCPFSVKVPEEQLWAVVEEALRD